MSEYRVLQYSSLLPLPLRLRFAKSQGGARLPGLPGTLLLRLERFFEARGIDIPAPLARNDLGEVDREAVGVVELESVIAADRSARAAVSSSSRLSPPSIVLRNRSSSARSRRSMCCRLRRSSGKTSPMMPRRFGELRQGRLAPSQEPGVTHRAAQDAAQHVATPLRRIDAVGQQERHGARVIGEDARTAPRMVHDHTAAQ